MWILDTKDLWGHLFKVIWPILNKRVDYRADFKHIFMDLTLVHRILNDKI